MNSVADEVRVTIQVVFEKCASGIGVMHSSYASLSCHLNSVDITFWNSHVLIRKLIYT